jgi:hypothetical protein
MKIPLIDYLRKVDAYVSKVCGNPENISVVPEDIKDRIVSRYIQILTMLNYFTARQNFGDKIYINTKNLLRAVVDYFVDSMRIKEFHGIMHTNREKIYAYMAYWLLKRKPIQAVKHFKGCEFVNEVFVTNYILSLISETKDIDDDAKEKNPAYDKFNTMLCYNLSFRIITQQSLELMIDAFFTGHGFMEKQDKAAKNPAQS